MDNFRANSKDYITEALIILLKTNSFKKITIGDICTKAGVSRVTFYRYFQSKEDILKQYFKYRIRKLGNDINKLDNITIKATSKLFFAGFKEDKDLIKALQRDGLIYLYMESLSEDLAKFFATSSFFKEEQSYVFSGALFSFSLWWVNEDCKTAIDEVVSLFIGCFEISEKVKNNKDTKNEYTEELKKRVSTFDK